MGLNTSHGCWDGAYSSFGEWRREVAKAAGLPPLSSMLGFGGRTPWDAYSDDPVVVLLFHSDCDGSIAAKDCLPLAERLEALIPAIPGEPDFISEEGWLRHKTKRFVAGLRLAHSLGEDVVFR